MMDPTEFAELPDEWRADLRQRRLTPVSTGMSGAGLWRIEASDQEDAQYLKLGSGEMASEVRAEAERTAWLHAQGVCVPRILRTFGRDDFAAVLMSDLAGTSGEEAAVRPIPAIARAFRQLHSLPVEQCPFDETLNVRLDRARRSVEAGGIEAENFFARNAHLKPGELYARLEQQRPPDPEDFVVIHGDAWLSNVIIGRDEKICFLDCGRSGRGDRYVDLAVLYDSFAELFGEEAARTFLREYGIRKPDFGKLQFFRDLYELF
jgi:aminoglycoside 3'-phosphotransferase II